MESIKFNEVQRFKTKWAWLGVAAMNVVFIYAIIQQVIIGKQFGSKPAPDFVLLIVELGLLILLLFLFSIRLKTKITDAGIYYRFFPFQLKETLIEWHDLKDAYIRQYNSYHEYGGWGLRVGRRDTGNAINTSASSNRGLQLVFNDGKLLLVGTTRPDEIEKIIETVVTSGKINRGI
jgi:hypothetical protein